MKIAIDATPVAHGSRAIRRHSKNLIEAMLRQDPLNEYRLLYIDKNRQRERYIPITGYTHVRECIIPAPNRILKPLWQYMSLPKAEWLTGKFDIFYATDLYFPPVAKGIVLGSVRGIAYHVIEKLLDSKDVSALKKGLAYTLKNSDYLLAVSENTRIELMEKLDVPSERIFVVTHGIDPAFCKIQDRDALSKRLEKKWGLSSDYVLFVGVIGHHKNVMRILKAYNDLRKKGIDAPLVLAGPPGSAWNDVKRFVNANNLSRFVCMTGLIDQDKGELTDLYNGASLFVFPSFYEGWTSPPLEAMACGTPVITSNCSSLPETVGDAARQIDPEDIEGLAIAMENILSDRLLRSDFIEKGFAHVKKHTWEKAAEKMTGIFNEIHLNGPWAGRKK
jgi:glycosyltransferase involved in cell wall biosynthesis